MSTYQIIRWNVVTDCNGIQRPMLYFKPDPKIVLQMQDNNNYLYFNIDHCELYSGKMIPALVDIASQQPNYRPNFFEACHLYCATLIDTPWLGFPNLSEKCNFSVYTGVIIPTCWRQNGNCPSMPSRHSGDEPSRHSGDEPSRHSGDEPSRHSGDAYSDECTSDDIMKKKCVCKNITNDSNDSNDDCTSAGFNVTHKSACSSNQLGDAIYSKNKTNNLDTNCYICEPNVSDDSEPQNRCKWTKTDENHNNFDNITNDIINPSSSVNHASIKVPEQIESRYKSINNALKKIGEINKTAEYDASTLSNIVDAEDITRNEPDVSQNTMYPRFNTQDKIKTKLDISKEAKYKENYKSKKSNSLVTGLIVLIILLFIFILILQVSKNNQS
jgi:hypothetical protein